MSDRENPASTTKPSQILRTAFRYLTFGMLGVIGLFLAIYATLLLFHLQKSEPNEAEKYFKHLISETAAPQDADNAAFLLAKFDAINPTDTTVQQTLELPLLPVVEKIKEICREFNTKQCASQISSSFAQLVTWKRNQEEYLSRYMNLLEKRDFHQADPFSLEAPIPPYNIVFDAQLLFHTHATEIALNGDTTKATELLNKDFLFWRMLFKRSDVLLTKMIAAVGLRKHFLWVNLINSQHFQGDLQRETSYTITPRLGLHHSTKRNLAWSRFLPAS